MGKAPNVEYTYRLDSQPIYRVIWFWYIFFTCIGFVFALLSCQKTSLKEFPTAFLRWIR